MIKFFACFKPPADPESFDRAYRETHLPLARKIPGLLSLEVSRVLPGKEGPSKYYQIAVLTFADRESFKAAMKSPENAAAGENLMGFARDLVEIYTAETID